MTPTGLLSPVPGSLTTPSPTTLGAAAGQVQGGRSKTGFIVAGVAVVAVAAAALVLVASKKKTQEPASTGSAEVVAMTTGSAGIGSAGGSAITVTPTTGSAGSAVAPETGSAGSGSAAIPANTGSAGSAATPIVKPDVTLLRLVINSTPEGAEIYLNGVDTGKKTNATLTVPHTKAKANIRLKLHGYADVVIRDVALDSGDEVTETSTLRAVAVAPASGGHTGTGKGSGKTGGGHHDDDDGLMRPE